MIKAYGALKGGQRPRSLLAWLFTIARNESFDMIRARRSSESLPDDAEAGGARPEEHLILREEIAALRADLDELPEGQRLALVMRGFGDLPHAEIARLMGRSEADARTLCHGAHLSLAEFDAGRQLDCESVLERIATGDARALRARRIRAHLRACDGYGASADSSRSSRRVRARALMPLPWLLGLRPLLSGGVAGVTAKAGTFGLIGALSAAVTTAVIAGGVVLSATQPPAPAPSPPSRVYTAAADAPASATTALAAATDARVRPTPGSAWPGPVAGVSPSDRVPATAPASAAAPVARPVPVPPSLPTVTVTAPSVAAGGVTVDLPDVEVSSRPTCRTSSMPPSARSPQGCSR